MDMLLLLLITSSSYLEDEDVLATSLWTKIGNGMKRQCMSHGPRKCFVNIKSREKVMNKRKHACAEIK